jgi:NhaA family Na+:H+ antiporter
MKVTLLFRRFFNSTKAAGLLLVIATACSLLLANSNWSAQYLAMWHHEVAHQPIEYWINDGLMAIFFLLIGLELEREVYIGELSSIKNAALPIIAAIGGMVVPAALFTFFNFGTPLQSGAGIPMATDIAFALGILTLVGKKVPIALKVFITALAVIDDLGAILIIAFFYTNTIHFEYLIAALSVFAFLLVLNRLKVRNLIPYLSLGVLMWWLMLHSGVHATISGVLLAFAIPFGNGDKKSTSYILQDFLHIPVAYIILPLFALANTGIILENNWSDSLLQQPNLGIIVGLLIGKPLGIYLFSYMGNRLGWCALSSGINYMNLLGAGFLGGIGFTMSIFISLLAFESQYLINHSKIAILTASCLAGIIGFFILKLAVNNKTIVNSI